MTERYKTRRNLTFAIIASLLFLVFGYTLYEIRAVAFGPQIIIASPANGTFVSTSSLEVSGTAKNIKQISLNDRNIFIDEKGNFKEEVLLSFGYNALVLKAEDKFGSKTEKILEVVYR